MSEGRVSELGAIEKAPSAMLSRPRSLFAWLGRRLFDHVGLDPTTAERLRALPERGQVVYVMRTRSLLDYLFFNHLFLKVGLPLARFANGVDLSFIRGPGEWLASVCGRLRGDRREVAEVDQLERVVRKGDSALVFMKRRELTAERQVNPGFIERLVQIQRQTERPILLLPQLISWPRKPPSKQRSWVDVAFGDIEASGRFRKLLHFFLSRKLASVRVGEPIDLKKVLQDHAEWSDSRVARKVRRVLFIHLGREAMAVSGPKVKPGATIRREILEQKRFLRQLRDEADRMGVAAARAEQDARRDLKEIASDFRFGMVVLFGAFLDFVFNRVFNGVEVDDEGMRRVREAARMSRSAPLVLVPCHKSHLDYLVISWVFLRNEFIPPHIAAGANLSFFPLGSLLRRSGAFFLRRSFAGAPLYKLVFRAYVWKLLREGYPVEFFMEGGRSRTGKLLPPKLGMLSMLVEGLRQGEYKDLQFVPIILSYEKVVETASYRRELTGGEKKSESVGGVLGASKVLRHRYGRVYVNFAEPVRLSAWLGAREVDDLAELPVEAHRDIDKRLAYHLMRRIHEATTVAPSALVAAVLLSHERRGISASRLREHVGYLIDVLKRRDARLSRSLEHTLSVHREYVAEADEKGLREGYRARGEAVRALVEEALFLQRRLVEKTERAGETIYLVPDKARIELDYYRNAILGALAPDALVAAAMRAAPGPVDRARLERQVRDLSYWFRLEFVYRTDVTFEQSIDATLQRLADDDLVAFEGTSVVPVAPRTLDFLRGTLLHLLEGYWVAADALRTLAEGPMEKADWLEHAREHAERAFREGEIRRAEAASTAVVSNALEVFRQEGLVTRSERKSGRKTVQVYQLAGNVSLVDIAFRRDDLGTYLRSPEDELLPQLSGALPALQAAPGAEEEAREEER